MDKMLALTAAALVCGLGSIASAAQLQNETFSTDGPVANYVGAGKVFSSATAGASMPGVSGGKLTVGFATGGPDNVGCVATALGGDKALVAVQFDITPQSYSAGTVRFVASDTSDFVWTSWDLGGRTWAGVRISETGLVVNEGGTVYPFTMKQNHTLTVFLNDSGASQAYTGPGGGSYTLNDQSLSVFDGSTALVQNAAKAGVQTIGYVGLLASRNWDGAETLSDIDNLIIRDDLDIVAVPEPTSIGLLASVALLGLRRNRR